MIFTKQLQKMDACGRPTVRAKKKGRQCHSRGVEKWWGGERESSSKDKTFREGEDRQRVQFKVGQPKTKDRTG